MNMRIGQLAAKNRDQLTALQARLGYAFREVGHLQLALIHSSYAYEQGKEGSGDNETLEFLGDAVLDLAVGSALFKRFPEKREGELTRLRAALVNEGHLASMAGAVGLADCLLLGRGEETSAGRQKPSILASAYEAVVGAIYLDGGFDAAMAFVNGHFLNRLDDVRLVQPDAKSRLQELTQERYGEPPAYVLEKDEGPPHDKLFTVSVRFRGQPMATGQAKSKKEAEQLAAAAALERFGTMEFDGLA